MKKKPKPRRWTAWAVAKIPSKNIGIDMVEIYSTKELAINSFHRTYGEVIKVTITEQLPTTTKKDNR